jgi:hypothetical protein
MLIVDQLPGVCPGCGRCRTCGQPYPQPVIVPYVPAPSPFTGPNTVPTDPQWPQNPITVPFIYAGYQS